MSTVYKHKKSAKINTNLAEVNTELDLAAEAKPQKLSHKMLEPS